METFIYRRPLTSIYPVREIFNHISANNLTFISEEPDHKQFDILQECLYDII